MQRAATLMAKYLQLHQTHPLTVVNKSANARQTKKEASTRTANVKPHKKKKKKKKEKSHATREEMISPSSPWRTATSHANPQPPHAPRLVSPGRSLLSAAQGGRQRPRASGRKAPSSAFKFSNLTKNL